MRESSALCSVGVAVTYLSAFLLASAVLGLVYTRRHRRAEAATILVVALPIVVSIPYNTPHWYRSLRDNYRLTASAAAAVAPPVITMERNLPLARRALASMAQDATFAVIPAHRQPGRSAERRRERARQTYLASWLQYWLAPRIRIDPQDAEWLILLDAARKPPPPGALAVYRIGDDMLVRRR